MCISFLMEILRHLCKPLRRLVGREKPSKKLIFKKKESGEGLKKIGRHQNSEMSYEGTYT